MEIRITIPETITVHLGAPGSNAQNVTVAFKEYIKNVASHELYPTWPEEALKANIWAQISYALNRIYTEWYHSRGYDFDITNSTQYDQSFVLDGQIFSNIEHIVDEIFNSYVRRQGEFFPYFTQYCDGVRTQCDGLTQWGSVDLAQDGLTALEILQRFYGQNIELVHNAPVQNVPASYPGEPLRLGDYGPNVRRIQLQLNRIARNWPGIPRIESVNGIFGIFTENAVIAFQRIFNLEPDGIVGNVTWYEIMSVYTAVTRLAELSAESILLSDLQAQFRGNLQLGDDGLDVMMFQYFLNVVAYFEPTIPTVPIDGIFGERTQASVMAFQTEYGLPPSGVVDETTWNVLYNAYLSIINSLPQYEGEQTPGEFPYPGTPLHRGDSGMNVLLMQRSLREIALVYQNIPVVELTGVFDEQMQEAVAEFQIQFGLVPTGIIEPLTWYRITQRYLELSQNA